MPRGARASAAPHQRKDRKSPLVGAVARKHGGKQRASGDAYGGRAVTKTTQCPRRHAAHTETGGEHGTGSAMRAPCEKAGASDGRSPR
jgi:hypothetical protein